MFIELVKTDGDRIMVNINHIVTITDITTYSKIVTCENTKYPAFDVKESYNEIRRSILEVKEV